tara:strand:- start:9 stop:1478 length:1470 start_codon:yes stop_codon:yes gene_type:complete
MNSRLKTFINYLFIKKKVLDHEKTLILNLLEENLHLSLNFLHDNIDQVIYNDIEECMFSHIYDILYIKYVESELFTSISNLEKEDFIKQLKTSIIISIKIIYKYIIPKREYGINIIRKCNNKNINLTSQYKNISKRIQELKQIKQPEQRSDEWYIFRNSTLTASNIWKVFISDYSQTQLVLEKCEPIDINKFKVTNLNSPLHWGQKYEPISTMYYEFKYNTVITEFGCIPHDNYPFIAASPDGIVCDNKSELFGRMLEIKNVVSREITGIPKLEYWIQMQIQMEVCDLNECDFLETKFVEYSDYEEYINDKTDNYKGIILLYFTEDNSPNYEYVPFNVIDFSSNEYKNWYNSIEIKNRNRNIRFDKYIYWRLDVISNVLVLRNKMWFQYSLPLIADFWNNLLEEKASGKYKERIKKKRKLQSDDNKIRLGFSSGGCLIDMPNNTNSSGGCLIDISDDTNYNNNNDNNNDNNTELLNKKKIDNFVINVNT